MRAKRKRGKAQPRGEVHERVAYNIPKPKDSRRGFRHALQPGVSIQAPVWFPTRWDGGGTHADESQGGTTFSKRWLFLALLVPTTPRTREERSHRVKLLHVIDCQRPSVVREPYLFRS